MDIGTTTRCSSTLSSTASEGTVNVSVELTGYKPVNMDYVCRMIYEEVRWMDTIESEPVYAVNALRARAT
jgi:hypothetical protein